MLWYLTESNYDIPSESVSRKTNQKIATDWPINVLKLWKWNCQSELEIVNLINKCNPIYITCHAINPRILRWHRMGSCERTSPFHMTSFHITSDKAISRDPGHKQTNTVHCFESTLIAFIISTAHRRRTRKSAVFTTILSFHFYQ